MGGISPCNLDTEVGESEDSFLSSSKDSDFGFFENEGKELESPPQINNRRNSRIYST